MSAYLPVEVMVEILKRLPVKSLVKCRSVCKTWNSLITNPSFISTHLQTSLNKPNSHLLLLSYSKNDEESFFLHFDNDDCDEFKQLHVPVASNDHLPYFEVVGSCNGLVCLCHYLNILDPFLWNPSIQKYIIFPKPSITCLTKNTSSILGFGFDSRTNDYKLLKVVFEKGETSIETSLFSLNDNSWKRITSSFPDCAMDGQISTFVNGAFHWLGYQREQDGRLRGVILGFDISTEQFFVLSLPESLIGLYPSELIIMKYEESSVALLKSDWEDDEQRDLWVMKKYGVVGTWTKVLHFTEESDQSGFGRIPNVLGFRKNGEVLLEVIGAELASLDLKCQRMKHLGIKAEYGFTYVDGYVESLVLLDKGVDAGCVSYAINHANDSSGSDAYSEEESEIA